VPWRDLGGSAWRTPGTMWWSESEGTTPFPEESHRGTDPAGEAWQSLGESGGRGDSGRRRGGPEDLKDFRSNPAEQTSVRQVARGSRPAWNDMVSASEGLLGRTGSDMTSWHGDWGRNGLMPVATDRGGAGGETSSGGGGENPRHRDAVNFGLWLRDRAPPELSRLTSRMAVRIPLQQMSTSEKLRLMEALSADLSLRADSIESPAWHADVLADREARISDGTARFSDWEAAKRDIRTRVS